MSSIAQLNLKLNQIKDWGKYSDEKLEIRANQRR